jgi:hypothetical protein
MIAGGYVQNATSNLASGSVYVYNPSTNSWSFPAVLSGQRFNHTATFLPVIGQVLFAGGDDASSGSLSHTELYHPTSGSQITSRLNTPRELHTATLLPNGKVLVVGGANNSLSLSSAELYDPAPGCTFMLAPLNQAFTASGGANSVSITAGAGCVWAAYSNVSWLTVTSGTGGSGNGTVNYTVAANTGPQRTGTMTIAGQIFTVTQDSGCPVITLSPTTLPNGTAGSLYSQALMASGGAAPNTFSLSLGSLPSGISLSAAGVLSGTSTGFGTFNFTVRATAANGCFGERAYALTINPPCGTITVNPVSLANGFVGTAYNQTFTQTGGTGTITWSVSAGGLPGGLNLAANTGALSGTPTTVGSFTFTIKATDNNGCMGARQYTLLISGNGLQFYPLPSPVRALETRAPFSGCVNPGVPISANATFTLPVRTGCTSIPANATAVTGNVTVVPGAMGGYLTLFPSSATQPIVANSNFKPGEVTNNVFTTGLGAGDGAFKIFASATTEVIVDITGYYAPPGATGLYFHPLPEPVRLVETRTLAGLTGCIKPGAPLTGGQDFAVQGRAPVAAPCNVIPAFSPAMRPGP